MGLYTTALVNVLQTIKQYGNVNKSLCMIGRQEILIEWDSFMKTVNKMHLPYDREIYNDIKDIYPINTYRFFHMFGIKEVHALDYSSLDGADILFNLNHELPSELCEKYDYIINGGTLEHVFDVAKAMKNMSSMLRVGGVIIHILPLGGYVDHGFYSFSPTFFMDYYHLNGFRIHHLYMEFMLGDLDTLDNDYKYADFQAIYSQDCRSFIHADGDWGGKSINSYIKQIRGIDKVNHIYIWCIAERVNLKEGKYPIQSMYERIEDQK